MNPIQIEPQDTGHALTAAAAREAEIDRALSEGGRLRPRWLDQFANWWAATTAPLSPGAAVDPGTRRATA
ncbi:hypothetical protein SAMN02982929_05173 [Saccharopolyspora kobensis]|uniref:Uncharacterized protein n=1 Tax=Saccharopolyspora kobensis TaxID=146035 RepID=A0A1H6DZW6_9PSEU|nr:hypothetical protein [Saccharopolyspora kobensis]SEG90215.1 hypothetical protein SAMN02982929_05173 [Saccharopolyspora kobensis]SFD89649.1 hypothetical protein SAMN05216506_107147 [Saccharopolyspora kobensis]